MLRKHSVHIIEAGKMSGNPYKKYSDGTFTYKGSYSVTAGAFNVAAGTAYRPASVVALPPMPPGCTFSSGIMNARTHNNIYVLVSFVSVAGISLLSPSSYGAATTVPLNFDIQGTWS